MNVECPKCHLVFDPEASIRYVVIRGRQVSHTFLEGVPRTGEYGKTLCGKLVDYDQDSISVEMSSAHKKCAICQQTIPVLDDPNQEKLFEASHGT